MADVRLIQGDCLEVLPTLAENSVDSIACDPPAGIAFMNKAWDKDKGGRKQWIAWMTDIAAECLRLLKPGGHALVWSLPRTSHWTATAWEDAGFELRDCVYHIFGSGFPKSLAVDKAIDKHLGIERELVERIRPDGKGAGQTCSGFVGGSQSPQLKRDDTPATDAAKQYAGFGSALKPAVECWWLLRKPLSEPTIAQNVLKWGTGAINVDACRIGYSDNETPESVNKSSGKMGGMFGNGKPTRIETKGRWPANLCLDEEAAALLDEMSGERKSGKIEPHHKRHFDSTLNAYGQYAEPSITSYGDSGGASRFFYCAKASKRDRDEGLDCTRTVKYNIDKSNIFYTGDLSWKDVSTVLVALLQKATSALEVTKWHIGESGASIMGQCPLDSLSTTLTVISRITTSQILSLLTPSLISDCIAGVNCETANGGSHAANAKSSNLSRRTITSEKVEELARGVRLVVSPMLSQISDAANWKPTTNIHSTVKPTALCRWLVRLVTPPGGTVLDPFMGSGSTGKAAMLEGFSFIGIDTEAEYLEIARRRIEHARASLQLPLLEVA